MEKVVQAPAQPAQPVQGVGATRVMQTPPLKRTGEAFKKVSKMKKITPFLIGILVILAGIGTGYVFARGQGGGVSKPSVPGVKQSENEAGLDDESLFPDQAEGVLKEGGIEGDGTHHLDRGMGKEKDVYLTSTVIDLQSFVGKEVEVWGESIASQKASWLMDVGKIKVKK